VSDFVRVCRRYTRPRNAPAVPTVRPPGGLRVDWVDMSTLLCAEDDPEIDAEARSMVNATKAPIFKRKILFLFCYFPLPTLYRLVAFSY